jgi:small neutral amino acid transporter SnatA (MarC family)
MYGSLLLTIALFVGPSVLNFFGVSLPDIEIAGGIFVFYVAWGMLTAQPKAILVQVSSGELRAGCWCFVTQLLSPSRVNNLHSFDG